MDLDPQANLSQYFMGAERYLGYIEKGKPTVVEVFEEFSPPAAGKPSATPVKDSELIHVVHEWADGSLLHLVPSRLELAWTLKNPTDKADLLPRFLAKVSGKYNLILIDCAPTESILTTAAYLSSGYVVVPVKPEFLATIGMPLLARSLNEFKVRRADHAIDLAGIVFNDADPQRVRPEHNKSRADVRKIAKRHGWPVFEKEARHSDSYATGSRDRTAIFQTRYARSYVKDEFYEVGEEFLTKIGFTDESTS